MSVITDQYEENYEEYYKELQNYLKSPDADKENIIAQLKRAHAWVKGRCGNFELTNDRGRDLVFNRVRFDYNGYLEHFESSFMNDLSSLSFELWNPEGDSFVEEA